MKKIIYVFSILLLWSSVAIKVTNLTKMHARLLSLFIILLSLPTGVKAQFITEWITTDGTLTIPTTGTGYNYTVSYRQLPAGLPTILTAQTRNVILNSLNNGVTYEISITGTFPRVSFGTSTAVNCAKIRSIKKWGSNPWTSMNQAFGGGGLAAITSIPMQQMYLI